MKRLILFCVPFLIAAAPPEPEPAALPAADLAALVREAEANHPALRAAAARVEAARHVPSQVGTLPDPEVSVSYLNDGVSSFTLGESEFSYLALTWTQEVPYPGKRPGRTEAAEQTARTAERDLDRVRLEIAASVKSAYADLYRLDRTRSILEESRSVLESMAQGARRRYEVGEGVQESVLKAQTELLRLEADLARAIQDRRAVAARLNALVGREADQAIGPAAELPEAGIPADADLLAEEAVAGSPEILGLAAAVDRGDIDVRLAELERRPDFIWSASYQNRGGLDPMVMGMFGVRLPLYGERRQLQALRENEAAVQAARADLADARNRTRAGVRELMARAGRADRLRVLIGEGVIPNARAALESAQTSYGVGRLQFLDLLGDLKTLLEARIGLAGEEADRFQALAALEPLVGRELIGMHRAPGGGGGNHESAR